MSADLARLLALQGLEAEDVDANRAGRVSPRQAAIVANRRRNLTTWLIMGMGAFVGLTFAAAITEYVQTKRLGMFIVAGVALAFGIGVYVVYTTWWRPPTAAELAERKVVAIEGTAESVSYWPHKGFYDLRIAGTKYQGYTPIDASLQGQAVRAYVVPDAKLVVAVTPID